MDLTKIDKDALKLSRSIGLAESGSKTGKPDYRAVGDNGTSKGAYQFQKATWENYAQQVLGDKNAQMTPENQDKVAYGMVKKWKDAGKKPEEIASMWNAGEGRPDAWKNHKGTTVINGKKISYDTPAYVQKVKQYYLDMAKQQQGQTTSQEQPAKETGTPWKELDTLGKMTRVATTLFPGEKIGEAIGTLGGYGYVKAKDLIKGTDVASQYDLSAPTPLQVAGDVAQAGLMVAPGLGPVKAFGKTVPALNFVSKTKGATGLLSNLARSTAYGSAYGLSGGLASGATDKETLKRDAIIGGALGLATGTASAVLNKLSKTVPQRIAQKYLNVDSVTAKKLVTRGLGTPKSMLRESNQALAKLAKGTKAYREEVAINKAIQKMMAEKGSSFKVDIKEFLAYLAGGLPAGLATYIGEGIATHPNVAMPSAGLLSNLANTKAQSFISPTLQQQTSNLINP